MQDAASICTRGLAGQDTADRRQTHVLQSLEVVRLRGDVRRWHQNIQVTFLFDPLPWGKGAGMLGPLMPVGEGICGRRFRGQQGGGCSGEGR